MYDSPLMGLLFPMCDDLWTRLERCHVQRPCEVYPMRVGPLYLPKRFSASFMPLPSFQYGGIGIVRCDIKSDGGKEKLPYPEEAKRRRKGEPSVIKARSSPTTNRSYKKQFDQVKQQKCKYQLKTFAFTISSEGKSKTTIVQL